MVTYTHTKKWFIEGWKATLTLLFLTFTLLGSTLAQSPCQAHRWASGDGWRWNSSTSKWVPTTLASPSLQPKGIVRCASSAETETALQDFAGIYDPNIFAINSSLTNCFNQETEVRGINISGPQAGEEIVWFNFDIRPLAGTYQFQIITNDQVGWVLYYVDPQYAQPITAGSSNGQVYPPTPPGLSGFTGNCTTDLSRLVYADCGISGNGWSTITVPSFTKPSNYYLAMWLLDPGTGPGKSTFSNNLIYKSRYGCGGVTCALEQFGTETLTCSTNSYTVCATYFGSAGKWALSDNAPVKASSYTVTTYDQNDVQVSTATSTNLSTNPLFVELGTIDWAAPNNDIKAVICATYPLGAAYNITLTPAGTPAGAGNDYVACTTGDSFSGAGLTAPNANAGADKVLTCTTTQIALSGSSTTAGVTYSWVASNGGHIVSGANTATPTVDAAGTYTLTVTAPNGCSATDVALVTQDIIPPANVNAGADQVLTCTVTSVQLSGSSTTAGVTYSWVASNGGHIVSGANTATPTVDAAGTYTLTVTNPTNGCTATDVALVTLDNTAPNVNAGADKVLTCTVTSIALSGSSTTAGVTYSWVASNGGHIVSGANTATPTVDAAGTYTLTVTALNGCTASDAASVTLNNTPPNANAGADKVLTCTTTQIALSGSSTTAGVTYSWVASNGGHIVSGANTATPIVDAAGTYTLTVTNPVNGCTATDVALVTLDNTAPNVNAGMDKVLTCTVTSIALSGSSTTAGVTYSWVASNGGHIVSGANTATPTVDAAGTYTLTVTAPNGCTASDVALVTLNNTPPNANAGADKVLTCTTTQIALSGSSTTAEVTYSWVASNGGHIVSGANTATPIVDAAGTYTLTVTNPVNGCTATDVALVTLDNTAPNVNAGADKVLTCTVTSIALSGSSTTAGVTYSWVASNGGHIVSGANTATPTVDAAGTYTLTVTAPNGCTATDVAEVTLNNTPPNANAGADKVLTCAVTSVQLDGSSTTAGVTYSWVASNGGHIVSGANTATPTVDAAGTYTLTVTNPVNGCTATDVALVTVNNNAPLPPLYNVTQPTCEVLSGSITVTNVVSGNTYTLTGTGVNITNTTGIFTNLAPGNYSLSVSSTENGCIFNAPLPITINPLPTCGETLCTYTQGAYGNEGGKYCTPQGQKSTYELIQYALDNWPNNTLYIGRPGHSLTIEMAVTPGHNDIQGVIDILPGGGKSTVLSGDAHASSVPSTWLKNGRLTNTLLAQTITLGLNMGITTNLANLELRSGMMLVTGDPLYGCNTGSTDVKACSYSAYNLYGSAVIQYLYNNTWNGTVFVPDGSSNKTATVYELFQLASAALGGVSLPSGISLDAIAGLEDQINNIFDGCQVFIGYMTDEEYQSYLTAQGCSTMLPTTTANDPSAIVGVSDLKIAAYPNPYDHTVNFNFTSPVAGKALLEVYDLVGRRLAVVFEGNVDAGMQKNVNYKVPSAQRVPMIYRLSIGGKTSFGKLLPGTTD